MHLSDYSRAAPLGLMRKFLLIAVTFAVAILFPIDFVTAAERVGEAVVVRNSVSVTTSIRKSKQLSVADPVNGRDVISAATNSHGELRLADDSRVIVGENSSITLDDFVLDTGGNFKSGTLKVVKGAFRFITGDSPNGTFRITTPLADIGIRGTVFDVYVDEPSGNTKLILFKGAVRVCNKRRRCLLARRPCDIIEVSSRSEIGFLPFLRSAKRSRRDESSQFGLSENQARFGGNWRARTGICNARAVNEAFGFESDNDTPKGNTEQRSPSPSRSRPGRGTGPNG